MRLQPATSHSGSQPHALVLGPRCVADRIARGLEELGYVATASASWPDQTLPWPSDPNALESLEKILDRFLASLPPGRPPRAHLVHPGCSVWADRPELVQLAQTKGLQTVAPPVRVVSLFSNKLNLLTEAAKAGVPNLVLDEDPLFTVREAEALFERQKRRVPFILKSVRGGGSSGVFVVHAPEDFERKLPTWIEQLRRQVGEVLLFAERYVEGARHVVVPFVRFHDGRFRAFPSVDSSLQSRWRKVLEFCPAENLDPGVERQLLEWTERVAEQTQYVGVGALEYLVDGERAFLVEGLCRLGAGYSLWEQVSGTSAVAWQLAAADGTSKEPGFSPSREWKSALCARILAEDPLMQLPQAGVVREVSEARRWRLPGATATLELPIGPGFDVSREGTGFLGLLEVGAQDRRQVVTIARGILEELWIAGSLQTNERFLSELLLHPWVREGVFHAGFVDEEFVPELRPEPEWLKAFASVCAAALPAGSSEEKARWAVADQWVKPAVEPLEWALGPVTWQSATGGHGISGELRLADGRKARVSAEPIVAGRWLVRLGAWVLGVRRVPAPGVPVRAVLPAGTHRLTALVAGRVQALLFQEGAPIPAHEPLLFVESLRQLVPHALPADAEIVRWKVKPEEVVHAGQELAWFTLHLGAQGG